MIYGAKQPGKICRLGEWAWREIPGPGMTTSSVGLIFGKVVQYRNYTDTKSAAGVP